MGNIFFGLIFPKRAAKLLTMMKVESENPDALAAGVNKASAGQVQAPPLSVRSSSGEEAVGWCVKR